MYFFVKTTLAMDHILLFYSDLINIKERRNAARRLRMCSCLDSFCFVFVVVD